MTQQGKLKVFKASAGAGKTFRLTVEYIMLLLSDPTEYQRILAVTFTNKATAEMKQRIVSQLYGIANSLSSSQVYVNKIMELLDATHFSAPDLPANKDERVAWVRERCAEALRNIVHDFSNFHVVTIDSFFQSVVRELANELGLSPNISVELNADRVLDKAVDEIIDNVSEQSVEYDSLVSFICSRFDEDKSWKVQKTVAEFGRNLLNENYLIHDGSVRAVIGDKGTLNAYREVLKEYGDSETARLNSEMMAVAGVAVDALMSSGLEDGFAANAIKVVCRDWTVENEWRDTFDSHINSVEKWLKKPLKGDVVAMTLVEGTLIPCLQRVKVLFDERTKIKNDVAAAGQYLYCLMILGKIGEQVEQLNREGNRFLLAETAHFLRDVINKDNLPFIYEKTGTTIEHIMIDEFQDTSALQWSNFKPLLTECLDNGNSCLIVGDVKQSIYRFRNSDWKTLNTIDQPGSGMFDYYAPIVYGENHRSSPVVVNFNNKFFAYAIEWLIATHGESLGKNVDALSTAYANMAQRACGKGGGCVRVIKTNDIKCLSDLDLKHNSDCCILVRTNKQAMEICSYAEEHEELDVKIVSGEAFRLDASSAVNIIIYALRCLTAMDDRIHLATLAYHYQTLVKGNANVVADMSQLMTVDDNGLFAYLPSEFKEEREGMRYKPVAEIVEDVYAMFELDALKEQDAYMFFFHDVVEKYAQDNLADIDSFLQAWDDELHEKTIPDGTAEGVRVMTMHKSKGLEFDTVIIPFCNYVLEPKDTSLLWCTPSKENESKMPLLPLLPISYSKTKRSMAFSEHHDDETLYTLVDSINLLYVGFTRAKRNLVILTDDSKKQHGASKNKLNAYDLIMAVVEKAMKDVADEANGYGDIKYVVETDAEQQITEYRLESAGTEASDEINDRKIDIQQTQKENPLTRKFDDLPARFVSEKSSDLASFRQSNESDVFISERSGNAEDMAHAERVRLIGKGNLYHAILQNVNTLDDLHTVIMRLDSKGCFEIMADRDETEQHLRQLITEVGTEHPEWFSPKWTPITERAVLFSDPVSGECRTKRPDRVVVKGNAAIVIDYKTGQDTDMLPKHRGQMMEYCHLMKELGYDDVKGYLWYINSQSQIVSITDHSPINLPFLKENESQSNSDSAIEENFMSVVASSLYQKMNGDFSDVTVVFPNKRASIFFNNYLWEASGGKTMWTPQYVTISELFASLSDMIVGDPVYLICQLYEVYRKHFPNDTKTLDDLYPLLEMMLADFQDVDSNLVPADKMFRNVKELQEMSDYSFLQPEQIEAIRRFFKQQDWHNCTKEKQRFATLWDKLLNIYDDFKQRLLDENEQIVYEGMLKRSVAEMAMQGGRMAETMCGKLTSAHYAFVGFNVLNRCEQELFRLVKRNRDALFYWDYDTTFCNPVQNTNNNGGKRGFEAGTFILDNIRAFGSSLSSNHPIYNMMATRKKEITFIQSSTENAQARYVNQWVKDKVKDNEALTDYAVVLCNESLLQPTLHSIPSTVESDEKTSNITLNITMGCPLADTPVYSLVQALLELQLKGRTKWGTWRYKQVAAVLKHPYVRRMSNNRSGRLLAKLYKANTVFPTNEDLAADELFSTIFTLHTGAELTTYIAQVLTNAAAGLTGDNDFATQLYKESTFATYIAVNRLRAMQATMPSLAQLSGYTVARLITQALQRTTVPFHGEPADGLQVMGFLETRNIDFKHVVMLSAGEGQMPSAAKRPSLIPYSLQSAFGMTTVDKEVSIYAYYFYRLLSRAESMTILWNASTTDGQKGEMSRFMLQMLVEAEQLFHPKQNIELRAFIAPSKTMTTDPLSVEKNEAVMRRLHERFDIATEQTHEWKEKHAADDYLLILSPSAINCYLECQMKFFFNYVAHLRPDDDIADEMSDADFGNIYHYAMMQLYKPYIGKAIASSTLNTLANDDATLRRVVDEGLGQAGLGAQLIRNKVLRMMLREQLLADAHTAEEAEKAGGSLQIVDLEKRYSRLHTVNTDDGRKFTVRLGGYIDRIDSIDTGTGKPKLRIVDYKTSSTPQTAADIPTLFNPAKISKCYHITQVMYYCSVLQQSALPCLAYYTNNHKRESPVIKLNVCGEKTKRYVSNFDVECRDEYDALLNDVIHQIFSPGKFTATTDEDICKYCDFKEMCHKNG